MKKTSKFRALVSSEPNKTNWYSDLRLQSTTDTYTVATDGYVIALNWASATGGAVGFLPYGKTGKTREPPLLRVHSRAISEMAFSPCQPNIFITGSDDGTIKYWKPNPMDPSRSPNLATLTHNRPVSTFGAHPSAADVILSGSSEKTVQLWDATSGNNVSSWAVSDIPSSIVWDYNGNLSAVTTRDKNLILIDPRAPEIVRSIVAHSGNRVLRTTFLGRKQYILTTGSNKNQNKEFAVWDPRSLDRPVNENSLGSASGVLTPMYDADLDICYFSAKGEGIIRIYEFGDSAEVTELPSVQSEHPSKGVCFVPKPRLDIIGCEIAHILKSVSNAIIPVSILLTRKARGFHEDLFPPTAACQPALSAADWFSGKNVARLQMSLAQKTKTDDTSSTSMSSDMSTPTIAREIPQDTQDHTDYGAKKIFKPLIEEDDKPIETLEQPVAISMANIVHYSKFKNIDAKDFLQNTNHFDIRVNENANSLVSVNSQFFAIPVKGTGGRILIRALAEHGRVRLHNATANANGTMNATGTDGTLFIGGEVTAMQWNPFDSHMLATGSEDCHIKLWRIPQEGLNKNLETPEKDFHQHRRKIQTLTWHPTAKNVLVSSAVDNIVKFWDIEMEESVIDLYGHPDSLFSLNFDWNGSRMLTACRDKFMRVWDPRGRDPLIAETMAHTGAKGFVCSFAGPKYPHLAVSAGFSKNSERQTLLWDLRRFEKPIHVLSLDSQSGVLGMQYDFENDIYLLFGKGDGIARFFEIYEEEDECKLYFLTQTSAGKAVADMDFFPKNACDACACELMRAARVVGAPPSVLERVSFIVPRTRMEYFQDDIFAPIRSSEPSFTASEWFDCKDKPIKTQDLCPPGMKLLSTAPQIEHTQKYRLLSDAERNVGKELTRDDVFNKFYSRMREIHDEMEDVDEVALRRKEEEDGWAVKEDEWD